MHKSALEPRKFDAELSAVPPVKRLNLSIVFFIGDVPTITSQRYILILYPPK